MDKKFGLFSTILLGINSIIGFGIFVVPSGIYDCLGAVSVVAYFGVCLLSICIALCFAEVAGYFEKNGAAYIYAKEAFGEFWGFEIGTISWLSQILTWATVAKVFSGILHEMYSQISENLLACALIILLGIINLLGVKSAKYLNNFFSIAKILVLFAFVIVGAFFIKKANFEPFIGEYLSSNDDIIGTLSIAFLFIFYVFCGFENIAIAAKDIQNPKRNLPIAIITVMLCVPFIYTLIQCVCVGILGSDLAEAKLPLSAAFSTAVGQWGFTFIAIGALLSTGGYAIALSFLTPRTLQALSSDGLMPRILGQNSRFEVPYLAIILTCALVCAAIMSKDILELAIITIMVRFFQYIPTCIALIIFRSRGLKSAFVVPFGRVFAVIAVICSVYVMINADFTSFKKCLITFVLIAPFYFLAKRFWQKA